MNEIALQIKKGSVPDGYKKTEAGIIPVDWNCVKLYEIADPITKTAGTDKYETLSISAGIGFVNQAEKFGKELSGKQYEKYIVLQKGDFSYNKGNSGKYPQGCIYRLMDRETAAVPNVFESFRLKGGYCPEFYDFLFRSGFMNKQLARKINHGVRDDGLLNLTDDDFYSTVLPVPSLEEQEKIAMILSACDRVIELKQKLVEELQRLKKTCLAKIFPRNGADVPELRFPGFTGPWEQRKLGDISDSYSGGTPTAGKPEYYGGDIPFIRSGEINENHTELFLTDTGLKSSSAKMVNEGDILYALYGANSGEVSRSKINGAINQAILAILPHAGFDTEFIMQWLQMKKKTIVETYLQGGQGNLSGAIVKDLVVDIPTYNEQIIIGDALSRIDNLFTLHQRELEAEKQKKKALMQLLLTGIVRVKA